MEKVIEKFKQKFAKPGYYKSVKLAYAIGYLEDCSKLSRKEAIKIIEMIIDEEL